MNRPNKILNHDLFIECLAKNEQEERERKFCRHNMGHFLDVARLAMIFALQEQIALQEQTDCRMPIALQEDVIYAAALLHDIGRFEQYQKGTPHEEASARIAPVILKECGYSEEETAEIVLAIQNHRNAEIAAEKNLSGILYRADKMSRSCFACPAEPECNWKQAKKNLKLQY